MCVHIYKYIYKSLFTTRVVQIKIEKKNTITTIYMKTNHHNIH